MKPGEWFEYGAGMAPPIFNRNDLVEVEYRNGRKARGTQPWMFAGWNHNNMPGDIVRYRLLPKQM